MDINLEKFIDFVKWQFTILLQNMEKFKHLIRAFWVWALLVSDRLVIARNFICLINVDECSLHLQCVIELQSSKVHMSGRAMKCQKLGS